jgi:hypothetical protein
MRAGAIRLMKTGTYRPGRHLWLFERLSACMLLMSRTFFNYTIILVAWR